MRVGDDERVRRRGDDLALQRRREPVHGGEQREVDLAALELCDKARRPETGRPQLQHDGRMPRMERSEKARHIDEVDPRHEPDGDGAAQFGAGRRDGLTELAHALEDVPGAYEQLLPRSGQPDLTMRTVEEGHAELAFELPHRRRHRGLRKQQPIRGPCEAHLLRDGDEDGEVTDIHTSIMPRSDGWRGA